MPAVAVKTSPAVPIPIWNGGDLTLLTVPINDVLNSGFTIPQKDAARAFEVAKVDFTLSSFGFSNPKGGDTSDAQVKMQGAATFENVQFLDKFDVKAEVAGDDYVVADQAGITLTGLDVKAALPTTAVVAGVEHLQRQFPQRRVATGMRQRNLFVGVQAIKAHARHLHRVPLSRHQPVKPLQRRPSRLPARRPQRQVGPGARLQPGGQGPIEPGRSGSRGGRPHRSSPVARPTWRRPPGAIVPGR